MKVVERTWEKGVHVQWELAHLHPTPSTASVPKPSNRCTGWRADVYYKEGGRQGRDRQDQGLDTTPLAEG